VLDYCNNGRINATTAIKKRRVAQPVQLANYPFKLKCSTEKEMPAPPPAPDALKLFRLKRRISYKSGNVRLDITAVKQASGVEYSQARMDTVPEVYEVEAEYTGTIDPSSKEACTVCCVELLTVCARVCDIMNGGWGCVPTIPRMKDAFAEYLALVKKTELDRTIFAGPQPVTLERRHLGGVASQVSISQGYTVTDKADGLRMLMYVAPDGELYMIDTKSRISATGIVCGAALAGTILDGEYITHTKLGPGKTMYMCFDIYWWKGKDVRSLPLIQETGASRVDVMSQAVQAIAPLALPMMVKAKKFYSTDIASSSRDLLIGGGLHSSQLDDALPYYIDGLIFTPSGLPVGAVLPTDKPRDGTWSLAFKWKPPQFNSIDFQVALDPEGFTLREEVDGVATYRMATLLVGATSGGDGRLIDPLALYSNRNANDAYVLRPFSPGTTGTLDSLNKAYLKVESSSGIMKCENGDAIQDGSIVEFRFGGSETDGTPFRWLPMRVRDDKARPNFGAIAVTNWKSIVNPVTESMVCGLEPPPEVDEDTTYYTRIYGRDKSAARCMLNFHNHWIKDVCIIKRVAAELPTGMSVLDIACGKGNDLPRWIKYGVRTLVGVDIIEENLLDATDGAYMRIRKARAAKDIKHAFVTLDAGRRMDASAINEIENPSLRRIGRSLWGIESSPGTEGLFGVAQRGFGLVACNFAVHYFFEEKDTLTTFAANVARHIAPGGYFIGTCFDSTSVHNLLRSVDAGEEIKCEKDGRTIWSITRLYDSPEGYGKKIAVYIETIGKKNIEYLVDFDELTQALAKHDIHLETKESFATAFESMRKAAAPNTHYITAGEDAAANMSDAEKRLSFLNVYFVFKKAHKSSQATTQQKTRNA
jgi:SAM-dependent methyltransferase